MKSLCSKFFYFSVFISTIIYALIDSNSVLALGNYPDSGTCPKNKPFYVFCSHSLHNLEGWVGGCHVQRDAAQIEADSHAHKHHAGKSRWTGVLKVR